LRELLDYPVAAEMGKGIVSDGGGFGGSEFSSEALKREWREAEAGKGGGRGERHTYFGEKDFSKVNN
jgi:hypothetical protein